MSITMSTNPTTIGLLPKAVRSKILSSYNVTSPEHVVEGLVRNALDAAAHSVTIEVGLARGYISVRDDGTGIQEGEFWETGQLAMPYCADQRPLLSRVATLTWRAGSSKFNSSQPGYGSHGRFLFSLSFLCLLSITSQHRGDCFASRLVLDRGVVVCRQLQLSEEDAGLGPGGTHVVVHNLFADVPVRSKNMSARYSSVAEVDKTFDRMVRTLVGYMLARCGAAKIQVSLKCGRRHYIHHQPARVEESQFTVNSVVSALFQAKLLATPNKDSWRLTSVRTSECSIRAALSTDPVPSRWNQFISIRQLPVPRNGGTNCLFDAINGLFEFSSFGTANMEDRGRGRSCELGQDVTRSGKCVDRWPTFYIRIDTKSDALPKLMQQHEPLPEFCDAVNHITNALESMISHFLDNCGFKREPRRRPLSQFDSRRLPRPGSSHPEPSPQLLSSDQVRSAGGARSLSHWQRVKSGRRLNHEDISDTLVSVKPFQGALAEVDKAGKTQALSGPIGSLDVALDTVENSIASKGCQQYQSEERSGEHTDTAPLIWTNPRNNQLVYLHPRTGAMLPSAGRDISDKFGANKCPVTGVPSQRRKSNLMPQAALSEGSPFTELRARVQKYNKFLPPKNLETPINSLLSVVSGAWGKGSTCKVGDSGIYKGECRSVTKEALAHSRILGQVDRKFILVIVAGLSASSNEDENEQLLVLIDQHAADERVKFESLCQELATSAAISLRKSLIFEVNQDEAHLLVRLQAYFHRWYITYTVTGQSRNCKPWPKDDRIASCSVRVTTLPALIAERCSAEPRLLLDLLRSEIWAPRPATNESLSRGAEEGPERENGSWLSDVAHCPAGMLEMLKSRSCRTAIMFNDALDGDRCAGLVRQLAACAFPFQCAHGRPSLTVLLRCGDHEDWEGFSHGKVNQSGGGVGFGAAWASWTG